MWAVDGFFDCNEVIVGAYQRDLLVLVNLRRGEGSIGRPVCYGSSYEDGNDQCGEARDGDHAQGIRG